MKMKTYAAILLLAMLCAGVADAVPPAYTGEFGNPEEPALRPLKWTYVGVKSLVQSTKDGLASGVEKDPASMAGEGALGAVKGTGSLVSSVGHGIVGAPLPTRKEAKTLSYEQAALVVIDKETKKGAGEQACCESAECQKATEQPDPAAQFRKPAPSTVLPAERVAAAKPTLVEESRVEKAQHRYVPVQSGYRTDHRSDGKGNLLNLAK